MRKITIMTAIAILCSAGLAHADEYVTKYVPEAQKVGEGRLSYLVWDVYDAALYAPQGSWEGEKPYALELSYLMDLKGGKIADRSAVEIRKLGVANEIELASWHEQMNKIFPNVSDNDTITGIYTKDGATVFYKNANKIGRIDDPKFSEAFFGIWLNEDTSSPSLRRKLLGGQQANVNTQNTGRKFAQNN